MPDRELLARRDRLPPRARFAGSRSVFILLVLSVALLLDHLGHTQEAARIEAAVAFDLATRDHQATGHTQSIGDRLAALVSRQAAPSNS